MYKWCLEIDAQSSSIWSDNAAKWGPKYAIDGLLSHTSTQFFHSRPEDNPWLQLSFSQTTILTGVVITNRLDGHGERLKDVIVRAGLRPLDRSFRGIIKINDKCGMFEGPGETDKLHTINCSSPITAKYVTVQSVGNDAILQINELDILSGNRK